MTCVCFRSRNSQSGTTHLSFTGQDQDTTSGLYDFLLRKYDAGQSRWTSPDPAGLSATSAAFPQSWNRYAYALNNPLVYRDPQGLFCVYLDDSGEKIEALDDNSDSGECGSNGGYRIPGEYGGASQISIDPDLGIVSGYGYLDGSWQYSVAGAMDSNTWGAWTQTADAPQQGSFGGNTSGGGMITGPNGPCTPSVFKPSCKPPSCLAVFLNAAGEADPLNLPAVPPGFGPDDAAKAAATALATKHIIERGLVVPLRSSIVRNILAAGEFAASAAVLVPAIYQLSVGLKAEYDARKARTCTTAFGN